METIPKKEEEKVATNVTKEMPTATTAVATTNQNPFKDIIQTIDLSKKDLTSADITAMEKAMTEAQALPIDLTEGYWTPQQPNEMKKLIFQKIATDKYVDEKTGDVIELETAHFTEIQGGVAKVVKNASWRLVKSVQSMNQGSVLLIIYNGKTKNKQNQNFSDNWIVKPLMINI